MQRGFYAAKEKPGPSLDEPGSSDDIPGDDLLSHRVAPAVPSALEGLTAVFGMGTGVTPPLESPGNCSEYLTNGTTRVRLESLLLNKFYGQASRPISTR